MLAQSLLFGELSKNMIPTYAFSTSTTIKTGAEAVNYTLLSTSTDYHIIGVRMQQEKDLSETIVKCVYNGKTIVAGHNYAKDYPLDLLMLDCNGDMTLTKTGADEAFVTVTYLLDSQIPVEATTTSATTTSATNTPQYINGFSYGDMVIAFFLLVLVANQFFGGILNRLLGIKQKPNYKIRL
jgi:hypothetical protein